MKQRKHGREGIGLILGILALLLAVRTLLNAQPPAACEPAGSTVSVATEVSPSATPEAEATATAAPTQTPTATIIPAEVTAIPLCSFAVPTQTEPTSESLLDAYMFSEPRVVLTGNLGFEIAQWLPDDQRLLIKHQISNQTSFEYIETLNTQTGEIQRYGETHYSSAEPIWLLEEHAVAYVDFNVDNQRALYIGQEGLVIKEMSTDVASHHLASVIGRRKVIYFAASNAGQPQTFDLAQVQRMTLHTNLALPVEAKTPPDYLAQYKIAVRPNSDQVAFYNNSGLYLSNTNTGDVCEIDLGEHSGRKQWALSAHWSPDGRYLAAFVAIGDRPVPFNHLIMVDMLSGGPYPIDLGNDYLYTLAWAPNSRDFLLLARDTEDPYRHSLQLVDTVTGQTRWMLEEYPFMYSAFGGVVWSSSGQAIALSCPIVTQPGAQVVRQQLCIIPVEVN